MTKSQPAVGQEVVNLGSFGGRKSGENVLHIFKGIDGEALASFDDAHDSSGGATAFFRAGKEPVASTDDQGFDTAFAGVVADFYEGMVEVNQKSRPAIERVGDCLPKFCFGRFDEFALIEPSFQQRDLGLCQPLTQILSFRRWQRCGESFNIEEALDDTHGEVSRCAVGFPGIFEVAVHMRPAVCCGSTVFNDLVVLIGAVGLENSGEASEDLFRVKGMLGVGIIVEDVGVVSIATVDPDISPMCFSKSLFDDGEGSGIRLENAAVQDQLAHSFNDGSKYVSDFFEPPAHRGATNGNAQGFKDLLLAVKRQVQPELIGCNFSQQSRTRQPFINRLVGFLSSDNLTLAVFAGVLEHDVLNSFEKSADVINLVRDIEANYFSRLRTVRAGELVRVDAMLYLASLDSRRRRQTSAALIFICDDIQSIFFNIKLTSVLSMDSFSGASQKSRVDFGGLLTEGGTVAATELLFQFGNASEQFSNELVAVA